jgi:hypothetical protein
MLSSVPLLTSLSREQKMQLVDAFDEVKFNCECGRAVFISYAWRSVHVTEMLFVPVGRTSRLSPSFATAVLRPLLLAFSNLLCLTAENVVIKQGDIGDRFYIIKEVG